MPKVLIEIIGILTLGLSLGIITIRYFFKGSILYIITALWIFTLALYSVLANLKWAYPETFPAYITLPFGILVVIFIFRYVAKSILRPLEESISHLKKISEGNLDITTNKSFYERNDELGRLTAAIENLTEKLNHVIEGISLAANELESSGTQLSSSAINLSEVTSEQASSLEEISSSMEEILSSIQQNADNSVQPKK